MNISNNSKYNRRGILKSTLGLLAGGLIGPLAEKAEAQPALQHVNRNGNPSQLKITDMRYTVVKKPGPSPCPIIRIDTNQGVYGIGEVRDVANYQYAMVLKSRIMGENPLNVDYLFEKIAQFGGIARQAGGVSAGSAIGSARRTPAAPGADGGWREGHAGQRVEDDETVADDVVDFHEDPRVE